MKPAARVTDMHVCPMVTGVVPHVGGPIAVVGYGEQAMQAAFDANSWSIAAAVPEPASWAMMIAGFGLTGAALRRRRIAVAA